MKNSNNISSVEGKPSLLMQALILGQFFFIIFIYHLLKDLKDTMVITSSDAGAEVIPFLKIWIILPFAVGASFLFSKVYQRFGREKTLYFFVILLLIAYALFAFCLYPYRETLHLTHLSQSLKMVLPVGCKGFIAMVCHWIYTFFYLGAELWSMMILTVLFWGYLNETTSVEQAKSFYPLCVLTGNCAGILSGQSSRYLCQTLPQHFSWEGTMQAIISLVIVGGVGIMLINRLLARISASSVQQEKSEKMSRSLSFKESVMAIFQSAPLMYIAWLVIGFGLTSNLIEVVWKDSIKQVYPLPQDYNAYVNQLTSIIGIVAVVMSLVARRIFQLLNWVQVALITPVILFITSFVFFFALQLSPERLSSISSLFSVTPLYIVMTLGSLYYVCALTAKYTIFDTCKEMAFLSIIPEQRMRAKSVIDSVGSRLGKSGSSCMYQALLILFGSTAGNIPIVGVTAVTVIGLSILATKKLSGYLFQEKPVSNELVASQR